MADMRYLKRRRQGLYFVMAVPTALRAQYGAGKVVASLGTRDLTRAQRERWQKKVEYDRLFERLANNVPLSVAEIDAQAREVYHSTLDRLDIDAKRRGLDAEHEIEALDTAMVEFVDAGENADFTVSYSNPLDDRTVTVNVIADELAAVGRRTGAILEPGTKTYRLLGDAILTAKIEALDGRMRALRGEASEPPATFAKGGIDPRTLKPATVPPRAPIVRGRDKGGKPFSEVAALYVAELRRDASAAPTEQTIGQHEAVYRLFKDYTRDVPLAAIDRATASSFLETVATLDPHWGRSPDTKQLSLDELLRKFGQGPKGLSNRTINRYASAMSSLYKWARKRGHHDGANPFAEQSRPKAKKGTRGWLPYTPDELDRIFAAPLFHLDNEARIRPAEHDTESAMRWVVPIALYSGMRLNEICQLTTADVRREHKTWFFNVKEDADNGQRVKTEAGIRKVPVHSELVKMGLLEYVKGLPDDQLFPGLRPGGPDDKLSWYFSRRYTEFRRGVGITRSRVSFHSFRKNFTTCLDNAGVPETDIQALIGHERGFTLETYSGGLGLERLKKIVEKVQYPGLDLRRLYVK
jgi:integrase